MKAIFIIAMITLSCYCNPGKTFLGNLKDNYAQARAEFDRQFEKMKELQNKAENLQDLAATPAGADPSAVVDTINGLTEAAKFWGSFIGNEIFDQANLEKKISQLHSKSAELHKYASEDGTQAMVALNQAIWDISVCIKQIQSLAIQLKQGAKNVQMITSIAFKNNEDMLMGSSKKIYEAAIKVLVNTLKSGNDNCAQIQEKLNVLSKQLITIETEMTAVSDRLKRTASGASDEFKRWRKDMRAKVYGGCAASILLTPAATVACYSIAAAALETEIAKYKREVEAFVNDFTSWSETFTALATMAGQASAVSKEWYVKVVDFKNVIESQYNLISGTADVLYLSHDLRSEISNQLNILITECDKIIEDTTGRLESQDESQLFKMPMKVTEEVVESLPEEAKEAAGAKITTDMILKQIKSVCQAAEPADQKAYEACVKTTKAKLMDM